MSSRNAQKDLAEVVDVEAAMHDLGISISSLETYIISTNTRGPTRACREEGACFQKYIKSISRPD